LQRKFAKLFLKRVLEHTFIFLCLQIPVSNRNLLRYLFYFLAHSLL